MYKKRSKASRMRAKTTHGYGSMKKNRGAGHKGGKGNAGSGKRADTKKPSIWKSPRYGRIKGFFKHGKISSKIIINISQLDLLKDQFIIDKIAIEKAGVIELNLTKTKYTKLLGSGNTKYKYVVKVNFASKRAIEKIEASGGKVITESSVETN